MESYNAMARRNRNCCNGHHYFTFIKVGGMQLLKWKDRIVLKNFTRTIEVANYNFNFSSYYFVVYFIGCLV